MGSGKTWGGSARLVAQHVQYPGTDSLAIEPTHLNLRQIMLPALQERLTELHVPHQVNMSTMEILTPTLRSKILMHSGLNAERITGFEVGRAWIDEPARTPEFPEPKRNIWIACVGRVRHPAVPIEHRGIMVTGTHEGKGTWVYRKWEQNPGPNYVVYRAATTDNPSAVEQAKLYLDEYGPELAEQYVYGQAVDDSASAIPWKTLASLQDAGCGLEDLATIGRARGPLFAGVDIGRTQSLTVIWIAEKLGDLLRTVAVIEFRGATFADQQAAIDVVCRCRALQRIAIDATYNPQTAEDTVEEHGEHLVEPVVFGKESKLKVYQGWIRACQTRKLRIPAREDILLDFYSVKRVVSSAGAVQYVAPYTADGHADRASAAALCVWAARGGEDEEFSTMTGPALRSAGMSRL